MQSIFKFWIVFQSIDYTANSFVHFPLYPIPHSCINRRRSGGPQTTFLNAERPVTTALGCRFGEVAIREANASSDLEMRRIRFFGERSRTDRAG